MNKLILLAACALLAGCDYTVPLVKTPDLDIDKAVLGLWENTAANGQNERLLILPLSAREYLVSFPAGGPDSMFARACLYRRAGQTLVQLEWIGTAQGKLAEDDRKFQFAEYSITNQMLRIRLLNPEAVSKEASSAEALAKALSENTGATNLYRDALTYRKVNGTGQK